MVFFSQRRDKDHGLRLQGHEEINDLRHRAEPEKDPVQSLPEPHGQPHHVPEPQHPARSGLRLRLHEDVELAVRPGDRPIPRGGPDVLRGHRIHQGDS